MRSEIRARAALPITREELVEFIAHLSLTGKKASTIGSYISGLAFLHKSKNFQDPSDCFVVRKLLEGCKRDQPGKPDGRRPLTLDLLKQALNGLKVSCYSLYETAMFQAAMVLAFYGFLRVGEFTAVSSNRSSGRVLQLNDIVLMPTQGQNSKKCVHVTIRYSKTDQRGKSTTLIIPETADQATCPVRALTRYLAMRTPGAGQLFWHFDKSPLTRYQFASILKKALNIRKVYNVGITTHSLRIGACTHFAMAGYSDDDLMRMGRWSSSAYQRYIRIPVWCHHIS